MTTQNSKDPKTAYLDWARKIAWSFHETTGIDFEDLFSEACIAYYQALERYDPKRGKITTYLWYCINNKIINYLREEKKYHQYILLFNTIQCFFEDDEMIDEDQTLSILETEISKVEHIEGNKFFETLSRDAQEIVRIIVQTPEQFLYLTPSETTHKIADTLLSQGWRWKRIWTGIRDLKLAVKIIV